MTFHIKLDKLSALAALPLALSLFSTVPAQGQDTAGAARALANAQNLGLEDTNKVMEATVWLNLHNRQELDAAVEKMYQPDSPSYQHWLNDAALAKFLPTAQEAKTVRDELAGKDLQVVSEDANHLYVRVRGTVGAMQTAFNTRINRYVVKGKFVTAAATEPRLSGAAAPLVSHIGGLDITKAEPYTAWPMNLRTRKPIAPIPLATFKSDGIIFSRYCFGEPETVTFNTPGAKLPYGVYSGTRYGAPVTNSKLGTLPPCGFDASEISGAYGLGSVYAKGYKGKGQTIVIVDAYGSPTIQADANTFSQLNGLPPLTSSNFHIYMPNGPVGQDSGWASETTLDVEWAHAIAPEAKIALIAVPSNSYSDLESGVAYALSNHLGNVISNSYGSPEAFTNSEDIILWNAIAELGASTGVSVNFSSGDYGDFEAATGSTTPTVSVPGDAPFATSVGGTSLDLNSSKQRVFELGWGTNGTAVDSTGVLDPPQNLGFIYGSGGGESAYFHKPWWQQHLPGAYRQQPDVSAVADPFTGVEIVINTGSGQVVEVIGGTSAACPIFSAIWAIANQYAGHALGHAGSRISRMPSDALYDVQQRTEGVPVAGFIHDSGGTTYYSPASLVAPLQNTHKFASALWNDSPAAGTDLFYVISFGTDSSLYTAPGWDNVTGFGTPNGWNFIQAAAR